MVDGILIYPDIAPVRHIGRRKHLAGYIKQAKKDLFLSGSLGFKKGLTFDGFGALGRQDRRKSSNLAGKTLIGLSGKLRRSRESG